jgi:transposase
MMHTMKRLQGVAPSLRSGSRRRSYDAAFKRHLVELSLVPGASVAGIALDHRMNANILFKWRRYHLRALAQSSAKPAARLLPVTVMESESVAEDTPAQALRPGAQRKPRASALAGVIEIDLPLGRVRLTGPVDPVALRVAIEVLLQR